MNLLIDAHIFDDKFQGTRTYLKGLYTALIPIAEDWNFYFAAYDVQSLKKEFENAGNVYFLQLKSKSKLKRLLIDLPKLIKQNNIDYSHYQYISPFFSKCKNIVTVHDILFREERFQQYFPLKYKLVNNLLFRYSSKKADILLTVSNYSKKKISEYYNIALNEIYVTPNAVSADFANVNFKLDKLKKKYDLDKYILYVSRVEPRKNHLALLQSFRELNLIEKGYKLVFIGVQDIFSPELEQYKITFEKELGKHVLWLQGISYDELKAFYKYCDLFVFPSFAEGFGIPPLEALVMGKKVLCSNSTAMKDFNFPEKMTFNPNDINDLKNKLVKSLSDNKVDFDVKKEILQKYNWEKIALNFYQLITSKMAEN